jgi:hypothetical protein
VVAALDLEIDGWWWSREGRRRQGRICAMFCSPAWDGRTDLSENEILFRWELIPAHLSSYITRRAPVTYALWVV